MAKAISASKEQALNYHDKLPESLLTLLQDKLGADLDTMVIPPPIFIAMQGEVIMADIAEGIFRCRFPVLPEQLNPFGYMQGGMVSAAMDNTIGPLSLLVAPPSVTLKMEVEYLHAVSSEVDYIYTTATFLKQRKKILQFKAVVTDETDELTYATARATHFVIKAGDTR